MTDTRDDVGFLARLRAELDELHQADDELRARQKEAWEQYCKRVDAILADLHDHLPN